jgi:pimeloyl-ACP methyl ester carboxylesterase
MPTATVDGLEIAYDIVGEGRPWIITPGGRYDRETPGVRELAEALAEGGAAAVIWDRPNTGASDVCFAGASESEMQADVLAGLLRRLDLAPAVIAGGSGGARVSLLAAARHPDVAAAVAAWWISGGPYGLLTLGTHYCGGSIKAGWNGGMAAVAALPEWAAVQERNPRNRDRLLAQDHREFIATMERWMVAYCPGGDQLVPGLDDDVARSLDRPALVFRSGESDMNHTRATSEALAALLPDARLVEPPWGDREWVERQGARDRGDGDLFSRWPLLAGPLLSWAAEVLG